MFEIRYYDTDELIACVESEEEAFKVAEAAGDMMAYVQFPEEEEEDFDWDAAFADDPWDL